MQQIMHSHIFFKNKNVCKQVDSAYRIYITNIINIIISNINQKQNKDSVLCNSLQLTHNVLVFYVLVLRLTRTEQQVKLKRTRRSTHDSTITNNGRRWKSPDRIICFYVFAFSSQMILPRCRMHTWSSDGNSVCLSVCPSVKRVDCDKTEEQICPDLYTIRKSI